MTIRYGFLPFLAGNRTLKSVFWGLPSVSAVIAAVPYVSILRTIQLATIHSQWHPLSISIQYLQSTVPTLSTDQFIPSSSTLINILKMISSSFLLINTLKKTSYSLTLTFPITITITLYNVPPISLSSIIESTLSTLSESTLSTAYTPYYPYDALFYPNLTPWQSAGNVLL